MNNIKRVFAFVLALFTAVSLSACGGEKKYLVDVNDAKLNPISFVIKPKADSGIPKANYKVISYIDIDGMRRAQDYFIFRIEDPSTDRLLFK